METGGTLNTAQKQADEIMLGPNGKDMTAALKEARRFAGDDSTLEKYLVAEVTKRFAEREAAFNIDLKQKKIDAVALALAGEFDKIPPGVLSELGGTMTASLWKISERKIRNAPSVSDPGIYNELNSMSVDDLIKVDLLQPKYLDNLSEVDFRKFSDRRGALIRGDEHTRVRTH